MNAPWTAESGAAAAQPPRDNFAAYVHDELTLETVREVVDELGWASDKCHPGGLRAAVQALSVAASPTILIVDLSECADPLGDIYALAEVCEPGTLVLTLGQVNDVRLYRDLLASGIQDYLLKPVGGEQLRNALAQAQSALEPARHAAEAQPARSHISAAVVGTRGGVGASTIATSLSWLFSTEHKMPTALLDLDVHFGTGALSMDLEPGRGLTDAIENPARIDGLFIERAMVRANDNLAILSAEAPINAPLMTDGAAFVQLEEEFRQAFEISVVDLPRNMLINFPHVLSATDVFVLVTELTLASARDAIRILSWLRANAPNARPLVVANKVSAGGGEISKGDFEASIERKLDMLIPLDAKAATHAAKLGRVFVEANRNTKAAAAIGDLARRVMNAGEADARQEEDASAAKAKFDLLGLLGGKQAKQKA